jgi:putative MFS transporter
MQRSARAPGQVKDREDLLALQPSPVAYPEAALISARLDRLPTTHYIWMLVLRLSLGGCFEFYDLFLPAYIGPGLVRSGLFSSASVTFFGFSGLASFVAASFAGLFIGTIAFGFVADRFGRRVVFVCSLLWYTAATVVMAFQATAAAIDLWRLIAGIGIGVELVTIDAFIAELVPKHLRGRAFAFNQVVQFSTIPVIALLAWRLVPLRPFGLDGWRWVALIGAVSAVAVWFLQRGLPESPRWLIARRRLKEADRVTTMMEARVSAEVRAPLPPPEPVTAEETHGGLLEVLHAPYFGRTLMMAVFNLFQTAGFYGFSAWVPTLLIAAGIATVSSLHYSFIIAIASPIGPLLALAIADRVERKWQVVFSALSIGLLGLLFAHQVQPAWLIAFGVLLTCANNWMSFAFHAYQAELFPTRVRARAIGFVYSWSRFSGIFTSLVIGVLLHDFGVGGVFAAIACSMLVAALSIGLFGPRTGGLALEAISH